MWRLSPQYECLLGVSIVRSRDSSSHFLTIRFVVRHFLINKAAHFKLNRRVVFPSHIDAFMQSGNRSSINKHLWDEDRRL